MITVTLVAYRPRMEEFRVTVRSLARVKDEVSRFYVLCSGTLHEQQEVRRVLDHADLSELTTMISRFDNLGFAGGHNLLLDRAFRSGAKWALVVNPDMAIEPGAITRLVGLASQDGVNALYGPAISRLGDGGESTAVCDSRGIRWTATGRHFDIDQGAAFPAMEDVVTEVAGVTGACLLVKKESFDFIAGRSGYFFDETFIAYREDAELGVRALALGVPSRLVETPGFAHARSVRGNSRGHGLADLLGVRNRFIMATRLGKLRPGRRIASALRDLIVVAGTLMVERSSLPGLASATRIRRYLRYTSPVRASR